MDPQSSRTHRVPNRGTSHAGVTTYNVDGYNSIGAWDGLAYFTNPATMTARGQDTFILIAAGKDRIYGSADDITSFGSTR